MSEPQEETNGGTGGDTSATWVTGTRTHPAPTHPDPSPPRYRHRELKGQDNKPKVCLCLTSTPDWQVLLRRETAMTEAEHSYIVLERIPFKGPRPQTSRMTPGYFEQRGYTRRVREKPACLSTSRFDYIKWHVHKWFPNIRCCISSTLSRKWTNKRWHHINKIREAISASLNIGLRQSTLITSKCISC